MWIMYRVNALSRASAISTTVNRQFAKKCGSVNALSRASAISTESTARRKKIVDNVLMPCLGLQPFLRTTINRRLAKKCYSVNALSRASAISTMCS